MKRLLKEKRIDIIEIVLGALTLAVSVIATSILGDGFWWMYLIPYLICAKDTIILTCRSIAHLDFFDENFLMSIATVGAFVIGEYPEAVLVMLLYKIGECTEDIAVDRSRESIKSLFRVSVSKVSVQRDGEIFEIPQQELCIGDTVVLFAGDTVPADSVIIEGEGEFDCSHLTGESQPYLCGVGDTVYSGSVNQSSVVKLRIKKSVSESMAAKILQITQEASARKSKAEKFISRFARVYTPLVVMFAAVLAFVPPLFYESYFTALTEWGYRALIFLVVSCPCALVISVPLGFFSGIGAASRHGILIKSSSFIEALSKAKTAVFDKTGTITEGTLGIVGIYAENTDADTLIEYAASLEKYSNHPTAHAICEKSVRAMSCENIAEHSGKGMSGTLDGKELLCGNIRLMREYEIEVKEPNDSTNTFIYVSYDGEYLGSIELADTIKKNAKRAIDALRAEGIMNTVMLTGDREEVAKWIARELSFDSYRAELLPDDKLFVVEELCKSQGKGERLMFAGDGINDTPSLARADIGVSMGALGSDAAIEEADVVLMDDDLQKLSLAIVISRKTMRVVCVNIVIALAVKLAVLLFGALGFVGMGAAVFADVGVTAIAVLNSISILTQYKKIN